MGLKKEDVVAISLGVVGVIFIIISLVIVFSAYPLQSTLNLHITEYTYNNISKGVKTVFYYITMLGEAFSYIAVLLALYYIWDKKKVFRIMVVLFSSTIINSLFKYSFNLSRPPKEKWFYEMSNSPGFPSGHAQMNTTFWGAMSSVIKKYWFTALSVVIVLLVSLSRIILCVHWFTDILGGLGIGMVIISLFIFLGKPIEVWLKKQSKRTQLMIVTILFLIYTLPVVFVVRDSDAMLEQLKFITLFATVVLSYIVEEEVINFNSRTDRWWKAVIRVIIGAIVFFGTYFALKGLFGLIISATKLTVAQISLDLLRYAILGPVAILLSPWIIMKLKI